MMGLKNWFRNKFPILTNKISILMGMHDRTYGGEYSNLSEILNKLEISQGSFVDIGAGDGYNMSVTYPLIRKGWTGILIELDSIEIGKAKTLLKKYQNLIFLNEKIAPNNSVKLIASNLSVDISFMNIDIDSYDLSIFRSVISSKLKPKVISLEINERVPVPIIFEVLYKDPYESISPSFYGCSIQAAYDTAMAEGYFLHSLAYNNAFFIRNDFKHLFPIESKMNVWDIYNIGYIQKEDREELFHWNKEFDKWFYQPPSQVIREIYDKCHGYEKNFKLTITESSN